MSGTLFEGEIVITEAVTETTAVTDSTSTEEPTPKRNARSSDFDRQMGAKIRAARVRIGMNQTLLGKAIGVSFQQMQKYEAGKDRVAAGTLQKLGEVLKTHPAEFFDDTPAPAGGVAEMREAMSIAAAVQRVSDRTVRKRIHEFVDMLAESLSS